jgi:hypothetical protein
MIKFEVFTLPFGIAKIFLIRFFALMVLFGCNNGQRDLEEFMVDVSEFKINDTILKDGSYVEILGSSGNLSKDYEIDFYNLVVVRSEATGDTINVLVSNFYLSMLNQKRTQFISNKKVIGKLIENLGSPNNTENLKEVTPKSYNKVLYDREYIQDDVLKYPTIIGNLGMYKVEGDLNSLDF